MTTPLTDATVDRIVRVFPLEDKDRVSALLIEECGDNLPLSKVANPDSIERIRFAVLKLSGGDLNALRRAIDLAKVDWRDVLVAAGFDNDMTAHKSWRPDVPARMAETQDNLPRRGRSTCTLMGRLARWFFILSASAIVLALPAYIAWEKWRADNLLAFCKDAKVGMSVADLLRAEDRHWIDRSFLVEALFAGYIDQFHSRDLEFRSHIYDPPFACFIGHDGRRVTNVQLVVTKDW